MCKGRVKCKGRDCALGKGASDEVENEQAYDWKEQACDAKARS